MNANTIALSLLVVMGASCHSTKGGEMPSEQEMMQRWMTFATPGKAHEALAPRVGSWNVKVRMFMTPGAPPDESMGTSSQQWVMDGRYIQDTTTGSFQGQPFHGLGLTGYDNMKQIYVTTWIDNMGTGIINGEGRYDSGKRTFEYTAMMPDAMVAQAYVPSRSTETWSDNDHFVVRNWAPGPDGKDFVNMELEYSRAR